MASTGNSKRLLLVFDVGTTFSGVSYSIIEPGQLPTVKGVTRFPGQGHVGGDSKIPSIIYYDQEGLPRAFGAEAENIVEDEEWLRAEWFKLHFRPASTAIPPDALLSIPALPPNKTVIGVFADYLQYLFTCARTYIEQTHANGAQLWTSFGDCIEFVITHPNGWEGAQQTQLRRAAIIAGLVPDTPAGRSRVHFVTEKQVFISVFAADSPQIRSRSHGEGVTIVDAGGGTIDVSSYGQDNSTEKLSLHEIAAPQCFFQGSIFVTSRAHAFMNDLLRDSPFASDVDHISRCFDKTTKLRFRDIDEPQFIKFGSARDRDLALGIRAGQLKIRGVDVAAFFEPSITCILKSILDQRMKSTKPINTVFLVGGFAASDWLFKQLQDSLEPLGISLSRPDSHVNKAVAAGGVSFYIDHYVSSRIAKYSYGISTCIPYDADDHEHIKRSSTRYLAPSGVTIIPHRFNVILPANTQVLETSTFQKGYHWEYQTTLEIPIERSVPIYCYRDASKTSSWLDNDKLFSRLCSVKCTTPPSKERMGTLGTYYVVDFEVVLNFGLTELTAHAVWMDKSGKKQKSPAVIIYDDFEDVQ